MPLNLKQKREGVQWFKKRVAELVAEGKSGKAAVAAAKSEGKEKFGAVDWAGILKLLEAILPLILKLFA